METEGYQEPVIHSYRDDSEEENDSDSFLSIPDESYGPRIPIYPSNATCRRGSSCSKNKSGNKRGGKQKQMQQQVFELEVHPRPLSPNIAYHNSAYDESDVELDIDMEFTPTPNRVAGLKKSKSKTAAEPTGNPKSESAGHHNPVFRQEDISSTSTTEL